MSSDMNQLMRFRTGWLFFVQTLFFQTILGQVDLVEKVNNPNPEGWANFGLKLSRSANFLTTGSRYADVSVDGSAIYDSGKAYVFKVDESNGSATLIDSFPSNDPYEGGGFGYTVSLDDGKLVVASKPQKYHFYTAEGFYADTNQSASVEVYDVDENGTAIFNQTILAPDNLSTRDSFGRNLYLNKDILTVPGIDYNSPTDSDGNATSRIYRYRLESNQTATLIQSLTLQEEIVDHYGEINFSQYGNRFVVGDPYDNNGSAVDGRVSIYTVEEDGNLTLTQSFRTPTDMMPVQDQKSNGFGRALAQVGNFLAVGAFKESLDYQYVGAVYLYKFDQNGEAQPFAKILPNDYSSVSENLKFGRSIEIQEKPDGTATMFVSAYHDEAGSLYEFSLDKNGSTQFASKTRPVDGVEGDRFGISLESSGDFLFVGAYEQSYGDLNESGAFYTYRTPEDNGDANKSLYNPVTQEMVSADLAAKSNTSPWTKLDPVDYPDFNHPAYYSTKVHQVLDNTEGTQVDGWVLTAFVDGASNPYEEINDDTTSDSDLVLYNEDTKVVITPEEIDAKTTSDTWISLSPTRYGDKYQYPAYYNLTGGHYVVQNNGTVRNGWIIMEKSSIVTEVAKVLFNQSTGEVITQTQVLASESATWMMLVPAQDIDGVKYYVNKQGDRFPYPAYYNFDTGGILDSSEGDMEDGWILTDPSSAVLTYRITLSSSDGGTVTGEGNYELKSSVRLAATPSAGYLFTGWGGEWAGTDNPAVFEATADLSVEANFAKDLADSDGDGLSNYDELVVYDTNVSSVDTDGDGLTDKEELDNGMNPLTSEKDMVDKLSLIMGARGAEATPYTDGWFYLEGRGWLFTKSNLYPYFYDHAAGNWLYFKSGHEIPRFYEYATQQWIDLGESD